MISHECAPSHAGTKYPAACDVVPDGPEPLSLAEMPLARLALQPACRMRGMEVSANAV